MVDAETVAPAKKPDLMVRAVSAIVMIAVLAVAVWQGDPLLGLFIYLVAAVCFVEFIMLVVKATQNVPFRLAAILAGAVYIGVAASVLADIDLLYFASAVGVVIFTDTFAYFFGRGIGGPKIAPKISPSKTWAGLLGGMIGAALFLSIIVLIYHYTIHYESFLELLEEASPEMIPAAIIGAVLAVVAQMGDFFQSWLKRKAGVKDSSKLIPGHGGIFDRIDGLLPVALVVGILANMAT
ncbi:phosphatidate cytidylyltransferase [Altererythrobacter sp. ZODW24]|uniref:phosphatidate cytidylyltransferase n=1 Tax=Altererythrobacter sp. ZODW24 TaxID=2185142 RepID=UPI000DF7554A|nr:phosphatidate cytidylyltransferase [Altererythrobacter sp. ZODW24]